MCYLVLKLVTCLRYTLYDFKGNLNHIDFLSFSVFRLLLDVCCTLQGMVDPGEAVTVTIRREFSEEALNKLEASPTEKKQIEAAVNALFGKGHEVG